MAASSLHPRWAWQCALLVSLALHAGAGGLLTLVSGPHAEGEGPGCVQVDACALDGEEEGGTAFLLRAPPAAAPAETPTPPAPLTDPTPPTQPATLPEPVVQTPPAAVQPFAGPEAPPLVAGEVQGTPGGAATGNAGPAPEVRQHGQGTSFFAVPASGETFVYLIDRSASMGLHGALAAARQELLASLAQLPPTARFQVIVYNRTASPLLADRPMLMPASPENLRRIAASLEGLPAEGGTDHLPALRRALAFHPDVLFFLTDADDLTPEHLRAVAQLNPGRHTAIQVIELNTLNRLRPDMPMHVLARDNRGTYQAVELRTGD
jgi:Ca-activated chloride channel family protein